MVGLTGYKGINNKGSKEAISAQWLVTVKVVNGLFAGAARRAGPDSMLILCVCVCVCVYLR